MKIGIDIDGVLAKNLKVNELHQGRDEEIYRNLPFDESSRKLLETLHHNNLKIYLITARQLEFQPVTLEWLQKHNIPYHEIFFSPYSNWKSSPYYKSQVVTQENITLLIDDLAENINHVNKETDCQGILFSDWNEISNRILNFLSGSNKKGVVGK